MNSLYRDAILKAGQVRKKLNAGIFNPINIFDSCIDLGVSVKFIDVNMEGLYVKQNNSVSILISNQRPLPRRAFTCAHELGHHIFEHGLKVDILADDNGHSTIKEKDEILVDAFAAALMMPVAGIQAEFNRRKWSFHESTPYQFYTISSIFGVGYQTLIIHCKVNNLIDEDRAKYLLKSKPANIFTKHFGDLGEKSHFKVIDSYFEFSPVDLEVSNYLILPINVQPEEKYLEKKFETASSHVYIAKKPGICRAFSSEECKNYFIRIQKENYIGLAEYRHFEN